MNKELVINARYEKWNRLIVVPQNFPPFISCKGTISQDTVEYQIKKYIEQDGDLEGWEIYHFCNWCMNFVDLKYQSEMCSVEVAELTQEEINRIIPLTK